MEASISRRSESDVEFVMGTMKGENGEGMFPM
jgi:hypothetical protein